MFQCSVPIKATKRKFGISELEFLGFRINATGYQSDPEHLKPLVELESPGPPMSRYTMSALVLLICPQFPN